VSALLEARGVRRRRGPKFVLDVEELSIEHGEILSILGPSGSGKSTLLEVVGLVEQPDEGVVLFEGTEVSPRSRAHRLRITTLLQSVPLFSGTVAHNVEYPLRLRGLSATDRLRRVDEVLKLVDMEGSADRPVAQLSGGEAQRVGLARAIASRPNLLLLDEPLAHSDEPLRERLALTLKRIAKDWGFSIVWVTHDRSEALRIADRVAAMSHGRVLQIDSPMSLITRPVDAQVAAIVGTENVWEGEVIGQTSGLATVRVSQQELDVQSPFLEGSKVFLLLRPEDVTVTREEPAGIAPRNRFRATLADAVQGVGTVKLFLKGPFGLVALLTRRSFEELDLKVGQSLWCSFKATACHALLRY
jgi:ABC-type Fe3+/spermidine/putrescine transport system ATPase subunit